jgi:hypothetical protein
MTSIQILRKSRTLIQHLILQITGHQRIQREVYCLTDHAYKTQCFEKLALFSGSSRITTLPIFLYPKEKIQVSVA